MTVFGVGRRSSLSYRRDSSLVLPLTSKKRFKKKRVILGSRSTSKLRVFNQSNIRRRISSSVVVSFSDIIANLIPAQWLRLAVVLYSQSHHVVLGEDRDVGGAVNDDVNTEVINSNEEFYMVLVFSLLFAFIITLVGAGIGYFSFKEDRLMRRYKNVGEVVRAQVVSTEFARNGGQVGLPCSAKQSSTEYLVFVEYNRQMSDLEVIRVRKQVRATKSDFASVAHPNVVHVPSGIDGSLGDEQYPLLNMCCCAGTEADSWKSNTGERLIDESSIHSAGHELELYLLPGFPRSGLPKHEVEQKCSILYRFSTLALILFCVALALFCTVFAANSVAEIEDYHRKFLDRYAIGVFFILFLLEIIVIHVTMGRRFSAMLGEEYLEGGHFISTKQCGDDSSMSSRSDAFLRNASRSQEEPIPFSE